MRATASIQIYGFLFRFFCVFPGFFNVSYLDSWIAQLSIQLYFSFSFSSLTYVRSHFGSKPLAFGDKCCYSLCCSSS